MILIIVIELIYKSSLSWTIKRTKVIGACMSNRDLNNHLYIVLYKMTKLSILISITKILIVIKWEFYRVNAVSTTNQPKLTLGEILIEPVLITSLSRRLALGYGPVLNMQLECETYDMAWLELINQNNWEPLGMTNF